MTALYPPFVERSAEEANAPFLRDRHRVSALFHYQRDDSHLRQSAFSREAAPASRRENGLDDLLYVERLCQRRQMVRFATREPHDAFELALERDGACIILRQGIR